jgi:hypothetical protein
MPTTASSSTSVNAALLRPVSINLAELRSASMCEGFNVGRALKGWHLESVAGFLGVGTIEITITVYTARIYIVNISLQCKY